MWNAVLEIAGAALESIGTVMVFRITCSDPKKKLLRRGINGRTREARHAAGAALFEPIGWPVIGQKGIEMSKQKALSKPPRYYWKRCYGMPGGKKHWALCDTHSDAREVPLVSDYHMVLLFNAPKCFDGKPLGKQPLPELIVKLLNEHFAKANTRI